MHTLRVEKHSEATFIDDIRVKEEESNRASFFTTLDRLSLTGKSKNFIEITFFGTGVLIDMETLWQ